MALEKKEEWKTIADVEALPEGTRAELIEKFFTIWQRLQ